MSRDDKDNQVFGIAVWKGYERGGVDLMFVVVSPYLTARKNGWLERVDLRLASWTISAALCRSAGLRSRPLLVRCCLERLCIIYNRHVLDQLGLRAPGTWEDLGAPDFFTWLASGDPRSSGSVHKCCEIILQAYGFEKDGPDHPDMRQCAPFRRSGEPLARNGHARCGGRYGH